MKKAVQFFAVLSIASILGLGICPSTQNNIYCYANEYFCVSSQPVNCNVESGKTAIFNVKAEGTGLTYQWQVKFPGRSWVNAEAASAKTATYTFTANEAHNGMAVRCVVKDAKGNTVTSNEASCSVETAAKITGQPGNCSVESGKTASFSVKAEGTGLTYQWQVKFPGRSWANAGAASAKTATYTFTANEAHNGMAVRCVVKDAKGNTVTSNEAKICVISTEDWELPIM